MNYQLFFFQIWNLLIFNFGDVDNDISCHVTLGNFQRWPRGKNCSLTYQYLIFSEKTKVTQFVRLCRIMTCLTNTSLVFFQSVNLFFLAAGLAYLGPESLNCLNASNAEKQMQLYLKTIFRLV